MNRVASTYSTNRYLGNQRVTARTLPALPRVPSVSRDLVGDVADVLRRYAGLLPPWVVFGMILLAAVAVCATATMRAGAELQSSTTQHQRMITEVEDLRKTNALLRTEVAGLQSDPGTIEAAARSRLNMVRPNEIVVSMETRSSALSVETQRFTR